MTLRLIHTSDWQIGKVFRFVDNSTMGLLQEVRLRAITRLGERIRVAGQAEIIGYNKRLGSHATDTVRHVVKDLFPKGRAARTRRRRCL